MIDLGSQTKKPLDNIADAIYRLFEDEKGHDAATRRCRGRTTTIRRTMVTTMTATSATATSKSSMIMMARTPMTAYRRR